jgi:hypothetical protein
MIIFAQKISRPTKSCCNMPMWACWGKNLACPYSCKLNTCVSNLHQACFHNSTFSIKKLHPVIEVQPKYSCHVPKLISLQLDNHALHCWKQINVESWKTTTWIVCTDEWNLVVLYPPRILKLLFKC